MCWEIKSLHHISPGEVEKVENKVDMMCLWLFSGRNVHIGMFSQKISMAMLSVTCFRFENVNTILKDKRWMFGSVSHIEY